MRKSIRASGFKWRPYVLRRYFDTRLMLAESDGLIINDWRVFFMGHKSSMEATANSLLAHQGETDSRPRIKRSQQAEDSFNERC